MIIKKRYFFLLLLLSSCAFHSGIMTSSVALTDANFKIVGLAHGNAHTLKVLGIGGLDKDALVLEAKTDMYKKYPLPKGQVFANITVDFKNSFLILFTETKVTVSADIIAMGEQAESTGSLQNENKGANDYYNPIKKPVYTKNGILQSGDSAVYLENNTLKPCKIKEIKGAKAFITKGNETVASSIKLRSLYSTTRTYTTEKGINLKPGDEYMILILGKEVTATVEALNDNKVIVLANGNYFSKKYNEIFYVKDAED